MKKPNNSKERNLAKGALRRVFSRSELRREALESCRIQHHDPLRPRVTKWSWCQECGVIEPTYKMEVDHHEPVVPIDKPFAEMSWDEFVDRLWCDIGNLRPLCQSCHHDKTVAEKSERKKGRVKK